MSSPPRLSHERLWDALAIIMALAAVIVSTLAVRRFIIDRRSATDVSALPSERAVANWAELTSIGNPIGEPGAPIRIVEFGDLQCPACARVAGRLDSAQRSRSAAFRITFVHFPLTAIHPYAFEAAVATQCAARRRRFEQLHDVLYAKQRDIGRRPWRSFAMEAGIADLAAFDLCLNDTTAASAVRQQSNVATRLGLSGTPTFAVDGVLFPGGTPLDRVLAALSNESNFIRGAKRRNAR